MNNPTEAELRAGAERLNNEITRILLRMKLRALAQSFLQATLVLAGLCIKLAVVLVFTVWILRLLGVIH